MRNVSSFSLLFLVKTFMRCSKQCLLAGQTVEMEKYCI